MELRFTGHAVTEMAADQISVDDVRTVVSAGTVIREYPEDRPLPSRLMLGWCEGRPVHVVCAGEAPSTIVVITTYRPDPAVWDATFTRRTDR